MSKETNPNEVHTLVTLSDSDHQEKVFWDAIHNPRSLSIGAELQNKFFQINGCEIKAQIWQPGHHIPRHLENPSALIIFVNNESDNSTTKYGTGFGPKLFSKTDTQHERLRKIVSKFHSSAVHINEAHPDIKSIAIVREFTESNSPIIYKINVDANAPVEFKKSTKTHRITSENDSGSETKDYSVITLTVKEINSDSANKILLSICTYIHHEHRTKMAAISASDQLIIPKQFIQDSNDAQETTEAEDSIPNLTPSSANKAKASVVGAVSAFANMLSTRLPRLPKAEANHYDTGAIMNAMNTAKEKPSTSLLTSDGV